MKSPWLKIVSAPLAVLALASPLLALPSCNKHVEVEVKAPEKAPPPPCQELGTGDFSRVDYGLGQAVDAKLKTLLKADHLLWRAAPALEAELIAACAELGAAAGMRDADLQAKADHGKGAERVCNNVAFGVAQAMKGARQQAKVDVTIDADPAKCYSDVAMLGRCMASCGSPVAEDLDLRAACASGDVGGSCYGRCTGGCLIDGGEGSGGCNGQCAGKCDRDFRGTCGGRCDGTCDGAPSRGKPCKGLCDGRCDKQAEGFCGGHCDGKCTGTWEPKDPNKCAGTCGGGCSGKLVAPQCSGDFTPPGADPLCRTSCQAGVLTAARCPLPYVKVTAKGGKQTASMQRLFAGIQTALLKIIRLQQGFGQRLPRAVETLSAAAIDWTNAAATAPPATLLCVRTGSDAARDASATINTASQAAAQIQTSLKAGEPVKEAQGPVE